MEQRSNTGLKSQGKPRKKGKGCQEPEIHRKRNKKAAANKEADGKVETHGLRFQLWYTGSCVSFLCSFASSSFGQQRRKKGKAVRQLRCQVWLSASFAPRKGLDFDLANDEASRPRRSWSSWFFGSSQAWAMGPGMPRAWDQSSASFSQEDSNRSETTEETAFHDHDIEEMSDDQFLV